MLHTLGCRDLEEKAAGHALLVVDVLNRLPDPERALYEARHPLGTDERLCVAEPSASAFQDLRAPQHRAYSRADLAALLTRTGWRVTAWVAAKMGFVCGTAQQRPSEPALQALHLARKHRDRGDHFAGLMALLGVSRPSRDSLVHLEVAVAKGELSLGLGWCRVAKRALAEAQEVMPTDPRAAAIQAELRLRSGDLHGALEAASLAVRQSATNPQAAACYARAVSALTPERGLAAWQAALRLAPADAGIARSAATSAAKAGASTLASEIQKRLAAYQAASQAPLRDLPRKDALPGLPERGHHA